MEPYKLMIKTPFIRSEQKKQSNSKTRLNGKDELAYFYVTPDIGGPLSRERLSFFIPMDQN